MKLQQLLSLTRKAVDTYHLIDEGDHIAIGFVRRKRFSRITLCLAWPAAFLPKEVLTDSRQCRSWYGRF